MTPKRRKYQRSLGERRYRKLFVIATEGVKTEPQYFAIFNNQQSVIRVNCLKGSHHSSPLHVLRRMEDHLKQQELRVSDEAWLVVDRDQWSDQQLDQLHTWASKYDNYGFALSNPKFEYWLLLHFEDGIGITSPKNCSDRLSRYLPGYDKQIDLHKFTRDKIDKAICRARLRHIAPGNDWPRSFGVTTVYRLVENLLKLTPSLKVADP